MSKVFRDAVVTIARAEVGYLEKASNACLDDKTANAGSNNYTKYARDLALAGYYNGNKNGYAWCDVFVDWCFYMAAGGDAQHAQEVECQTGEFGAGCGFSARYYANQGRLVHTPEVGDQIFFGSSSNVTHTGLVVGIDAERVYTVEGNTSAGNDVIIPNGGAVAYKSYLRTNGRIYGYGRPKYDKEEPEMTKSEVKEMVDNAIEEALGLYIAEVSDIPHESVQLEVRQLLDCGAINGGTPSKENPDDIRLPHNIVRALVMAKRYTDYKTGGGG